MKLVLLLLASSLAWGAEKVEILRDEYGIPHIFATTAAGAAFGSGYAQAQDRLEELLRNYRKAEGTMAEAFGPEWVGFDYRQRLWRHREVAEQHYKDLAPNLRAICEAYQAGIKKFMQEHPEQVPAWAPKLEPWQIIALGRFIIWRWPEGEIAADLQRGGIPPDTPRPYLGSNEWLLAPSRTAMGAPIAVVDPHVDWYGEMRFYEMRIYAGDLAFSGAAILGQPFPSLGHSRYLSIAMTTGGPETSDVYEEEVRDGKYRFRDQWRPLEVRNERIGVKEGNQVRWQNYRIESTGHGPIVAHKNGKAYAAGIPYADQYRLLETTWQIATAHHLNEAKAALANLQFMAQNIMIGTVDGDIYYVRNGRVPIRPAGCDPSRPMSGADGNCEWRGIHPFSDLLQITNPPQGYMQNCNVSPVNMMKGSPLAPDRWTGPRYLYNETAAPPHQRAAMVLDLLDAAHHVTAQDAMAIAVSPQVWHADAWQERIRKAAPDHPLARLLIAWDRRADANSRAALAYYLFKTALGQLGRSPDPPVSLTDDDVRTALDKAAQRLAGDFSPEAVFGTLFRVGRQGAGRTFPVGGGSLLEAAMATPRAINFGKAGNQMVGHSGQSCTQVVVLTKPPQSWMVIPLGESDHPESGHFDDQAEKLFSRSQLKPTYFLNRKELEKHVTAKTELSY
jgi:acyl-homoserine-lactone acylase